MKMTGLLIVFLEMFLKKGIKLFFGPQIRRFPTLYLALLAICPILVLVMGWDETFTLWIVTELGAEMSPLHRVADWVGAAAVSGTAVHRLGHGVVYHWHGVRWGLGLGGRMRSLGYLPEDEAKVTPAIGRLAMLWGPAIALLWEVCLGVGFWVHGHNGAALVFFLVGCTQLINLLHLKKVNKRTGDYEATDGLMAEEILRNPAELRKLALH
jgi:hypothetical protein